MPDTAPVPESGTPVDAVVSAGVLDAESEAAPEVEGSADAAQGVAPSAAPMPSATANAPTRPMRFALPITASFPGGGLRRPFRCRDATATLPNCRSIPPHRSFGAPVEHCFSDVLRAAQTCVAQICIGLERGFIVRSVNSGADGAYARTIPHCVAARARIHYEIDGEGEPLRSDRGDGVRPVVLGRPVARVARVPRSAS